MEILLCHTLNFTQSVENIAAAISPQQGPQSSWLCHHLWNGQQSSNGLTSTSPPTLYVPLIIELLDGLLAAPVSAECIIASLTVCAVYTDSGNEWS